MATTIDLWFRDSEADDEESRHVGTVDLDDLDDLVTTARRWGFVGDGITPIGQFTDRGFEVAWVSD